MSFDDVLHKYVGEAGRYQVLVILTMCVFVVLNTFSTVELVFTMHTPAFFWPAGRNISSVNSSVTDPCTCSVDNNGTLENQVCTKWDYDDSVLTETVITKFDLVCHRAWLGATASSVYFLGFMAVFPLGMLSDRFGRRPCFAAMCVLWILARVAQIFSPTILFYTISRFIVGITGIGKYTAAFVLASELVGPRHRVRVGTSLTLAYFVGCLLTVALAYCVKTRFYIEVVPSVLDVCILPLLWFVPESPRWLYSRGRVVHGNRILRKMASCNGREFPVSDHEDLSKLSIVTDQNNLAALDHQTASLGSVLKAASSSPTIVFRTVAISFVWCTVSMSYYALTLNTGNLAGNLFLNTFFLSMTEMVGYTSLLFIVTSPLGRAGSLSIAMLLSGLFVLATVPLTAGTASTVLSLLGKLCLTFAFGAVYIYTVELFPTAIRNIGVGLCSFLARIGGVLAPFIISAGVTVSVVLIGVTALLSGILLLFLPETLGSKLPQDIKETEAMDGLLISKWKHFRDDLKKDKHTGAGDEIRETMA